MKGRVRASLILAAVGAGGLLFFGCARGSEVKKIAYVENVAGGAVSRNNDIWNGVIRYTDENSSQGFRYTPESLDLAEIEKTIDAAVSEGASTIICLGQEMGQAVFDMQRMERDARFIFIGGVPRDEETGEERIRGNTTCIAPAEEQAGFLAGYAAVSEGYTDLLVLGARRDAPGMRHITGFVQGAEQAVRDAGSNAAAVQVTVRFLGGNVASPALLAETEEDFAAGRQLIYAYESGTKFLAAKAAASAGGRAILGDGADGLPMNGVMAVVDLDYEGAAYHALDMDERGSLETGTTVTLYVDGGGAEMWINSELLRYFTQDDLDSLAKRIASGRVRITDQDVTGEPVEGHEIKNVSVVYEGE